MSYWDLSWEERQERRREEEREFRGDVFYEAWRRGLDPDRALDCADDCREAGRSAEQCVDGYEHRILDARHEREAREAEEAHRLEEAEREYYARQEQEPTEPHTEGGDG